jgi:hypothetical protein
MLKYIDGVDFVAIFAMGPAVRRIGSGGPRRRRGDDELESLYEITPDSSGAGAGMTMFRGSSKLSPKYTTDIYN